MGYRSRAARGRDDANQAEIVQALRQIGARVVDCSGLGAGAPDLLVAWRGRNYLIEVKTAKGKLNATQRAWHADWPGQAAVAYSLDDVFMILSIESENV